MVQDDHALTGVQQVHDILRGLGIRTLDERLGAPLEFQPGNVVQEDRIPLAGQLIGQPALGCGLGGMGPDPPPLAADGGDGAEEFIEGDPVAASHDKDATDHLGSRVHILGRPSYYSLRAVSAGAFLRSGRSFMATPTEAEVTPATRELVLDLHRRMVRIRRFEESSGKLVETGEMPGFLHLYVGQEAVASGVMSVLTDADQITSTHRGHGHAIAKGAEFRPMFAELYAKTTGYCKGRGGSMHIVDMNRGMLGANAIVGGGIPIAIGAGFASQYRGDGTVAVSFFGDGATNIGAFHESVNMAAVWDLPVIFVIENNGYAEFTSQERHMKLTDIAERASSYGIPGVIVDGMDALAVRQVAQEAVDRAKRGEGPTLIEAKTYRFFDHQGIKGMRIPYRDPAEVEAWKSRDAIRLIEAIGVERGLASAEEFERNWAEVEDEINDGIEFARNSPDPDPADILDDVYTV